MKLFVDDVRAVPKGWELARTNTEAIRLLASGQVKEISLDHDIMAGYWIYDNCEYKLVDGISEETYQPVAYYISLMLFKPKVIFHTGNFDAGKNMAEIIGCEYIRNDDI